MTYSVQYTTVCCGVIGLSLNNFDNRCIFSWYLKNNSYLYLPFGGNFMTKKKIKDTYLVSLIIEFKAFRMDCLDILSIFKGTATSRFCKTAAVLCWSPFIDIVTKGVPAWIASYVPDCPQWLINALTLLWAAEIYYSNYRNIWTHKLRKIITEYISLRNPLR